MVPASAAWFEGEDPGRRLFADVGALELENGTVLPSVTLAYETYGSLNSTGDNAVLVLHGFSADSHAAAHHDGDDPGWWEDMIGPGRPIDTRRFFVVVPNALGGCQGSTGPASLEPASQGPGVRRWGGRFPRVTTRDQVIAEIRLAQHLGVRSWAMAIGPSMGGLRALEWAVIGPEAGIEVRGIVPIGAAAATGGDVIAWSHPQLEAIRLDPGWLGGDYYQLPDGQGPHRGMAIARFIAHNTYRTASEYDNRFGRLPQGQEDPLTEGRFAVQSYLDHQGDKLARRFDANSYIILTESMNSHDLGRGRGGDVAVLSRITARTLVIAMDTDRMFPAYHSTRLAQYIPGAELRLIHSAHGHDGFLIEFDQLGPMIAAFLAQEGRVAD
jgi:homoserine O-acetyltransferase